MEARRLKEDKERQEKYLEDIEDLPPLEPLEEMVEDEQRPSTSGTTNITRTIVRTPSWEREDSDEWDEDKWEKTVQLIATRPEFGEDRSEKGKGKKGSKKSTPASFGEVIDKKEHKLLDSRCSILYEISQGLESAKQGVVSVEDREFFEKMERGYNQLEKERARKNIPKVWERAGLKEEEEGGSDAKDYRGRRKDRKRDSKEGRHRE